MIRISFGSTVPLDLTKNEAYKHISQRSMNIKRSILRVTKEKGHLIVRCPVSGDYLDVQGSTKEIEWLDHNLEVNDWYKIKKS